MKSKLRAIARVFKIRGLGFGKRKNAQYSVHDAQISVQITVPLTQGVGPAAEGLALHSRTGPNLKFRSRITPVHTRRCQFRFFMVTPTPVPCMCRKSVSRSGFVVIASMYRGSAWREFMLWARMRPPGRIRGRSFSR